MKYISIIIMSLFLVGNAYSINSSTIWKKGKIILQSNTQDIVALIEYKDVLYYCWANTSHLTCYEPKKTQNGKSIN